MLNFLQLIMVSRNQPFKAAGFNHVTHMIDVLCIATKEINFFVIIRSFCLTFSLRVYVVFETEIFGQSPRRGGMHFSDMTVFKDMTNFFLDMKNFIF